VLAFRNIVREEGDCLLIFPDAESGM